MTPKAFFVACFCWTLAFANQLQPRASHFASKRQDNQQPIFAEPSKIPADDSDLFAPYWKFHGPQQPHNIEWEGKDSDWFSSTTLTTSVEEQPTEAAQPVGFQAAKNEDSGDLDIALSPAVLDKVKEIFKNAPKCGGTRRKLRIRADACGFRAASQAIAEDSELNGALQQVPRILADAMGLNYDELAAAGSELAFTTMKDLEAMGLTAELMSMNLNLLGGLGGIGILAGLWHMFDSALEVVPVLGIPMDNVAETKKPEKDNSPEEEDKPDDSNTCPPQGSYEKYPLCGLENCKAQDGKCTTDEYKDCTCVPEGDAHEEAGSMNFMTLLDEITFPDPESVNEAECNTDRRLKFEPGSFQYMASYFCRAHAFIEKQETVEVDSKGKPHAPEADEPHVKWSWSSGRDDCTVYCTSMVERLTNGCWNDDGGYAQSGKVTDDCGEVSYEIQMPEDNKPEEDPEPEPEEEPEEPPFQPSISCGGSSLCGGPLLKQKQCDWAVNTLTRDRENPKTYGTGKNQLNGNCRGASAGNGCGVFLEGDGCEMIGDDMWDTFQEIRTQCPRCGKKEYSSGCFMKIDYVTLCDDRDYGV